MTAADAAPVRAPLVVDVHEPDALVARLQARGVPFERRALQPADFVVGRLAIERKTVRDFQRSLVQKRLFDQVARLRAAYEGPVALLLEGDLGFVETRQEPRSLWGALAFVALDLDVTILPTPSLDATADLLATLARRVQATGGHAEVRFKPRAPDLRARQKFAVQGLPGVGDVVSENLLEHFGSVRRVFAADARALLRVPGVGKLRAQEAAAFLDAPYAGRHRRLDA